MTPYDIIGDTHGHYDKPTALVTKPGCAPDQGMVAYRWDGEALLDPQKFLTACDRPFSTLPIPIKTEVNGRKTIKRHTLREGALHP